MSATSVAAVINHAGPPWPVSSETRERIVAAAAKLQYRPNAMARALAIGRMQALGVVVGSQFNDYLFEVLHGIITTASRHGQNTTVFTLNDWTSDSARLFDFCDSRIDGLIMVAPTFTRYQKALPERIPMVSIHANCDAPGIVNIESDEERGAYDLVRHLIERGHRRIMHLTGPVGLRGTQRRIRGYRRALAEAGIPLDSELEHTAGCTTGQGNKVIRCWLQQHSGDPLPHAVFCANDASAIGCLEAFAEIGLRVPDDVSVAGFDDTFIARRSVPQLTTVRQPLAEMGARAVEQLLAKAGVRQRRAASDAAPRPVVFPVKLVPRSSVGECPTGTRIVPARRPRTEDEGQSTNESKCQALVLMAVVVLLITLAWRAQPIAIAPASTHTISITLRAV